MENLIYLLTAISDFLVPNAIAQGIINGIISSDTTECDFLGGQISAACVTAFITDIIEFVFALVGSIALIQIIISGYQIALAKVTGRDRSEGLTRLRVAIIGFIICGFAWYIIDFVISSLAGI